MKLNADQTGNAVASSVQQVCINPHCSHYDSMSIMQINLFYGSHARKNTYPVCDDVPEGIGGRNDRGDGERAESEP